MDDPVAEELLRLRMSIDNMDAALVHLLAERFKVTQQVGELKAAHGLPPADPTREAQQIARLRALAEDAKLDPEFAEKFLNFVIAEVVRHHEAVISQNSSESEAYVSHHNRAKRAAHSVLSRRNQRLAANARPVTRPVNKQPPRNVPSRAR